MRSRLALCSLVPLALMLAACGGGGDDGDASVAEGNDGPAELVGVFNVDAGVCEAAGPVTKGSYFRMIAVNGDPVDGPFLPNGDSPCGEKTFSPLLPGEDGGLRTGAYQAEASPPFDDQNNGVTGSITKPTKFVGTSFANATNEKDPQTGAAAPPPRIVVQDGKLSGDLSAYAAAWNKQHFNQGAPKPGGERPGLTVGPTGTYDEGTKAYTLEWSSQIVGGPFNNFTGVWHLEGSFAPEG